MYVCVDIQMTNMSVNVIMYTLYIHRPDVSGACQVAGQFHWTTFFTRRSVVKIPCKSVDFNVSVCFDTERIDHSTYFTIDETKVNK